MKLTLVQFLLIKKFFFNEPEGKTKYRKEIGMVFRGGALFDSKTIEENLMVPLIMFSSMSIEQMKIG